MRRKGKTKFDRDTGIFLIFFRKTKINFVGLNKEKFFNAALLVFEHFGRPSHQNSSFSAPVSEILKDP